MAVALTGLLRVCVCLPFLFMMLEVALAADATSATIAWH